MTVLARLRRHGRLEIAIGGGPAIPLRRAAMMPSSLKLSAGLASAIKENP
jgi:hypothetical protein